MTEPDLAVRTAEERDALLGFVEHSRGEIRQLLDDLTDEELRSRLVPSATTVLGLVKHCTFVERVWFLATVGGRPRSELGLPETVEPSFELHPADTADSVRAAFDAACAQSRQLVAGLALDDEVEHRRFGRLSVRWILLHLVREYARHAGHGDILREQLLARR
ncbi:DinB family protein [Naumannella sp. ID2617S]|nr:DinB family protein [Naumannella sp. ID2617S]